MERDSVSSTRLVSAGGVVVSSWAKTGAVWKKTSEIIAKMLAIFCFISFRLKISLVNLNLSFQNHKSTI